MFNNVPCDSHDFIYSLYSVNLVCFYFIQYCLIHVLVYLTVTTSVNNKKKPHKYLCCMQGSKLYSWVACIHIFVYCIMRIWSTWYKSCLQTPTNSYNVKNLTCFFSLYQQCVLILSQLHSMKLDNFMYC